MRFTLSFSHPHISSHLLPWQPRLISSLLHLSFFAVNPTLSLRPPLITFWIIHVMSLVAPATDIIRCCRLTGVLTWSSVCLGCGGEGFWFLHYHLVFIWCFWATECCSLISVWSLISELLSVMLHFVISPGCVYHFLFISLLLEASWVKKGID